jgi:hypothetical protein
MNTPISRNFRLSKYFELLDNKIQNILLQPEHNVLTYDILDTQKTKKHKLLALKEKQRQMKVGKIWQEVLGNYNECTAPPPTFFFRAKTNRGVFFVMFIKKTVNML